MADLTLLGVLYGTPTDNRPRARAKLRSAARRDTLVVAAALVALGPLIGLGVVGVVAGAAAAATMLVLWAADMAATAAAIRDLWPERRRSSPTGN